MQSLDLRLFNVFEEIYKSRSVSRAADALGLGQPAVSIALARLREHFGDPLFVRVGASMEPTPLGRELAQPMHEALEALDRALAHRSRFDPRKAERRFSICMSDISQVVLLPALWSWMHETAPGVQIDIQPLSAQTRQLLESGTADLAIGFMPHLEAGFFQQLLFPQRYVCMVRRDHPRVCAPLSVTQFEQEAHAVVSGPGTGHSIVDSELARLGIRRRIVLRVPNFVGLAHVIERTDLMVIVPQRLGDFLQDSGHFRVLDPPMPLPGYSIRQHWHERFHHDPGSRWLRGVIFELLAERGTEVDQAPVAVDGVE